MRWMPRGWLARRAAKSGPNRPPQGSGILPPARLPDSDAALSLGAVYRSVQILSTAGSQLTLDGWRQGALITEKPAVIRKPDPRSSLSEFLALTINSMALAGNAYWKITRTARGAVSAEVLNPWECSPQEDGRLGWRGQVLAPDEFEQMRLLPRPGHLYGLGPIQAARETWVAALDLRDYAAAVFTTGDVPSGVLSTEASLTSDQAEAWAKRWREREPRTVAVLGNGLSYEPILIAPEDAQFIESQKLSVSDIARLFGIPAHMLLASIEGSSLTYQNMAQADLAFVRWSLMSYLRPIEEAFTEVLARGNVARFNLDAITRPDLTTRYTAHNLAISAGFMTVNEARAIEGMPPIPGGNSLRAPTTQNGTSNA